jgi:hypothetical protein
MYRLYKKKIREEGRKMCDIRAVGLALGGGAQSVPAARIPFLKNSPKFYNNTS